MKKDYTEQLDMNVGTAQNRLVKDVLFKLLTDNGLNECYQCGKPMCRKTFTLEHKKPWRNETNAKELFFNLDNVSFSHQSCNSAAARRTTDTKFTADETSARKKEACRRSYNKRMKNRTPKQKEAELCKRRERYANSKTIK